MLTFKLIEQFIEKLHLGEYFDRVAKKALVNSLGEDLGAVLKLIWYCLTSVGR